MHPGEALKEEEDAPIEWTFWFHVSRAYRNITQALYEEAWERWRVSALQANHVPHGDGSTSMTLTDDMPTDGTSIFLEGVQPHAVQYLTVTGLVVRR